MLKQNFYFPSLAAASPSRAERHVVCVWCRGIQEGACVRHCRTHSAVRVCSPKNLRSSCDPITINCGTGGRGRWAVGVHYKTSTAETHNGLSFVKTTKFPLITFPLLCFSLQAAIVFARLLYFLTSASCSHPPSTLQRSSWPWGMLVQWFSSSLATLQRFALQHES